MFLELVVDSINLLLNEWEEFCMATTKKRNKTLRARLNKRIPSIFKSKSKRGF